MCTADILEMGHAEHILQEAEVLDAVHHPFVANKVAAFSSVGSLFLVTELCEGGDLFDALHVHRRFTVADTRILTSQVLLPVECLHASGIVHRDLKLENLLLAQDGALKLSDFGFAKRVKDRTWTLCGTPEYLAPEIILEMGHGKAVDYWALGVLLYEMLNGHSPFEADDPLQTYERVLGGRVRYPPRMPPHAVDLISRLLERETSRRFGNLAAGAADVRRHPFYEHAEGGFTWAAAYSYRATIHAPSPVNADDFEWLPAAEAISDLRPCTELGGHLFARVFGTAPTVDDD